MLCCMAPRTISKALGSGTPSNQSFVAALYNPCLALRQAYAALSRPFTCSLYNFNRFGTFANEKNKGQLQQLINSMTCLRAKQLLQSRLLEGQEHGAQQPVHVWASSFSHVLNKFTKVKKKHCQACEVSSCWGKGQVTLRRGFKKVLPLACSSKHRAALSIWKGHCPQYARMQLALSALQHICACVTKNIQASQESSGFSKILALLWIHICWRHRLDCQENARQRKVKCKFLPNEKARQHVSPVPSVRCNKAWRWQTSHQSSNTHRQK